ncbi:MAG: ABC transporter ATP-binding protein [Synergistaceae bacterium]|nr:ABC transporter ATP-binding protein [Synergistaceae bacterium]
MIEVKNLSVKYAPSDAVPAVDNISLTVKHGERIALLGANGAGKTTLLLSMVGILQPSEGDVFIDGMRVEKKNLAEARRKTALVFQNPDDQLFMPTVMQDVTFGSMSYGMDEEAAARRADKVMATLGVERLRSSMTSRLSSGEKRLVALAGVLVMEPDTILMDEPTSFLDIRASRELAKYLSGLSQSMIIATHDLGFAKRVCKRVVLLESGKMRADMPFDKFMDDGALRYEFGLDDG